MTCIIHFKNDIKQIMRDPIMAIMMLAPLITIVVFKLLLFFLMPFIVAQTGLIASLYYHYLLAFILLTNAGMLGIVTGFMMLDDRDGNISELMAVTPLGRMGYLFNRLLLASLLSCCYALIGVFALHLVDFSWVIILFLPLLMAAYSAIIGLLIFWGADDKVKGLTYAKALNTLILFAFADLFSLKWLSLLSWLFPPYWVAKLLAHPESSVMGFLALLVHLIWLGFLILRYWRQSSVSA